MSFTNSRWRVKRHLDLVRPIPNQRRRRWNAADELGEHCQISNEILRIRRR
jgi:hypothetical protein